MKFVLVLSLVCAVSVLVFSEPCRRPDDCNFEVCSANASHIACHGGTCTCDPNAASCALVTDCHIDVRCRDRNHHIHCVDARCTCLPDRPNGDNQN